jgi:hypothetical protein
MRYPPRSSTLCVCFPGLYPAVVWSLILVPCGVLFTLVFTQRSLVFGVFILWCLVFGLYPAVLGLSVRLSCGVWSCAGPFVCVCGLPWSLTSGPGSLMYLSCGVWFTLVFNQRSWVFGVFILWCLSILVTCEVVFMNFAHALCLRCVCSLYAGVMCLHCRTMRVRLCLRWSVWSRRRQLRCCEDDEEVQIAMLRGLIQRRCLVVAMDMM